MLTALRHEILAALRALTRAPGFTAVAIAMLALGIGANVAIFSLFHTIVLSPLPYADASRLVGIDSVNAAKALRQPALSAADFRDVRERTTKLGPLAAFRPDFIGYTPASGEPAQVVSALVTEDFFAVFGLQPREGRTFRPDEFPAASARTAVISAAFWRREFGGARGVVGRAVTIDRQPTTIIGIMPETFREPEFVDVWLPFDPEAGENLARDSRFWNTVGRLKAGATLAAAQAELATIAAALAQEYPAINRGWTFAASPLLEQRVGAVRGSLLLMVGAVGLVLLVVCVNLANLLLARGLRRMPQFAVRLALGATPAALARSVLWESLALAGIGGLVGTGLAAAALAVASSQLPPGMIPRSHSIGLDPLALSFSLGLAGLTGLIFGSLPAWQVARANVNELLKSAGTRGTGSRTTGRLQSALVVIQVALTMTVLSVAAQLAQGLQRLQATAPGFDPSDVLAVRIAPGQERWNRPVELAAYYDRLVAELQGTPGIVSAAIDSSAPLCGIALRYPFWVQGRPRTEGNADEAVFNSVTPAFASTLKIPLRRGRFLEGRDDAKAPRVCVINESLARRIFPNEDPIGKRIQVLPWLAREYREVVGVIADTRQASLAELPPPQIYVPSAQSPWFFTTILVRTSPSTSASTVQAALRRADPALTMSIRSLGENIALTTAQPRLRAGLIAAFAVAALVLSAFGIYASMAFTVSQRTREFGVRMALGANPRGILRLVLARAARVSAAGIGMGVIGAVASGGVLRGAVHGIDASEPLLLLGLAVFLALIALLAAAHPAWLAARLSPTRALQQE